MLCQELSLYPNSEKEVTVVCFYVKRAYGRIEWESMWKGQGCQYDKSGIMR